MELCFIVILHNAISVDCVLDQDPDFYSNLSAKSISNISMSTVFNIVKNNRTKRGAGNTNFLDNETTQINPAEFIYLLSRYPGCYILFILTLNS